MTRLQIRTPSRLHFGLLSWGVDAPRQFGGVGLMIDRPGLTISAEPAASWTASGPLARLVRKTAAQVVERLMMRNGRVVPPLRLRVEQAPAEHMGLGVGTQLSLAIAQLIATVADVPAMPVAELAMLAGHVSRSGIGLHGFALGGLIVDGGRRTPGSFPPLLTRIEFPADWQVLVVLPPGPRGLSGAAEAEAFAMLPPLPDAVADRLCRLVLMGLLPAVVEHDLAAFGAAVTAIQFHVGRGFAPAQNGSLYARPDLEPIIDFLRENGLHSAGQSSWGPALYAFSNAAPDHRAALLIGLCDRFQLNPGAAFWTQATHHGAFLSSGSEPLSSL